MACFKKNQQTAVDKHAHTLEASLLLENYYTTNENRTLETRMSVENLPCQWFFTWLSGVAVNGSSPKFVRAPWLHVLDSIGLAIFLLISAGVALYTGGVTSTLAIPLILIATGRCRKTAMTIQHQSSHGHLLEIAAKMMAFAAKHCRLHENAKNGLDRFGKCVDRWISNICTAIFWIATLDEYIDSHAKSHHRPKDTATRNDDDAQEFYALGFVPGKSIAHYWLTLITTLFNPWWYLKSAIKRIFVALSKPRTRAMRLTSFLLLTLVMYALASRGVFAWIAVAYLFTVFIGVPGAALLQQVSEHLWGCYLDLVPAGLTGKRVEMICQGRFNLDFFPIKDTRGRWWKIIIWLMRIPYHLFVRLVVLPGDLSAHAVHHLHCNDLEWVHAPTWTLKAYQNEPGRYRHCWSLGKAISRVFTAMSHAKPF